MLAGTVGAGGVVDESVAYPEVKEVSHPIRVIAKITKKVFFMVWVDLVY